MLAEVLMGSAALLHLLAAPHTKVEESFNMQACHDFLYHGFSFDMYDHLEYPGVVPRSFLGSLTLSIVSYPIVTLFKFSGISKLYSQLLVRGILGAAVILGWLRFCRQIKRGFGPGVTVWFTLITVSQFHFIYYLSRTLPNTFALIFSLFACSYWLQQNHFMFILMSGIGCAVFRMDLLMMMTPMLLHDIFTKRVQLTRVIQLVVGIGLPVLIVTVLVDSFMWRRLVWAEGEVFWFNTVLNKSHMWGTLPLSWYFYSALPRALGASYLLVPIGLIVNKHMRVLTLPALIFVVLFSFLPHKELRFIIYSIPLFNVAAAVACQYLWRECDLNFPWRLLRFGTCIHLLANCFLTATLLTVSAANYPGGVALLKLHQLVPEDTRASVHIDNLSAQTGVTRFLQLNDNWIYNKTEDLKAGSDDIRSFSHLLVEADSKQGKRLAPYIDTHNIIDSVETFSHLSFNYQNFPPVKVRTKPAIFILENLIDEDIRWFNEKEATSDQEVTSAEYVDEVEADPKTVGNNAVAKKRVKKSKIKQTDIKNSDLNGNTVTKMKNGRKSSTSIETNESSNSEETNLEVLELNKAIEPILENDMLNRSVEYSGGAMKNEANFHSDRQKKLDKKGKPTKKSLQNRNNTKTGGTTDNVR